MQRIINLSSKTHLLILIGFGLFFYIPFLGHINLFDWDEVNFAECAREMIISGNYTQVQINFEPFCEKPPLFFWLQTICMKLFGVGEFAARLPNALIGICSLCSVYLIGREQRGKTFGLFWAITYCGSILPFLYFKSGIIDPTFNLLIFLGIYFFYRSIHKYNKRFAALSGIFIGLSLITKGPVGLLLFGLCFLTYFIWKRFHHFPSFVSILLFLITLVGASSLWYGIEIINNGTEFIQQFITYQIELFTEPVAGHQQPFYYHFVVVLLGCFPMSIIALPSFRNKEEGDLGKLMLSLFWVVMILFSIVSTKIVHYSSMAYLPLSFLAASYLYKVHQERKSIGKGILISFITLGTIIGLVLCLSPFAILKKETLISIADDENLIASLSQDFDYSAFWIIVGLVFLMGNYLAFIHFKRGYPLKSIIFSSLSITLSLVLIQITFVPEIEKLSQRPMIDFFEERSSKDVYLASVGMKTYTSYFYGKTQNKTPELHWLLRGEIDKPVYFVCRITHDGLQKYIDVKHLYDKGAYSFYRRIPSEK